MSHKILIVDDEPTSVFLVKSRLQEAGYEIFEAKNGKEGLALTQVESFDLIITDILMPVMDGVDFYKELKKSSRTVSIPIAIITQSEAIQDSFRALGVNDFFSKPLDPALILDRVKSLLDIPSRRFRHNKIFVVGTNRDAVREMEDILIKADNDVLLGKDATESFSKILAMVPDIILVDVMLRDFSARELISAVRCFLKLQNARVFLFSSFSSTQNANQGTADYAKAQKEAALKAGAHKDLGNFNSLSFYNDFQEALREQKSALS